MDDTEDRAAGSASPGAERRFEEAAPPRALDLDTFLGESRGWGLVHRLQHIARTSPEMRVEAMGRAVEAVKEHTRSVPMYRALLAQYAAAYEAAAAQPPESAAQGTDAARAPPPCVDAAWCESVDAQVAEERAKLQGELRLYQNNSINESVRMAHHDLARHLRQAGELDEALAHYEKMREYYTTSEDAVEMYLGAMQVAWEMQQPSTVLVYVDKAESVMPVLAADAAAGDADWRASLAHGGTDIAPPVRGAATSGGAAISALFRSGGSAAPAADAVYTTARTRAAESTSSSVPTMRARLAVFRVLASWAAWDAPEPLPPVVYDAEQASAYADLATPTQLAWYAALWALSTPPAQQRERVESLARLPAFSAGSASDVAPRELFAAYLASDVGRCLQVLHGNRRALELDMTLGPQRTAAVVDLVESRVLTWYLCAFRRCSLAAIGATLGWDPTQVAARLIEFARDGALVVHIDWADGSATLSAPRADDTDPAAMLQHVHATSAVRRQLMMVQEMQLMGCV
ncbi:hypothetical protein MSPP1_003783 [Malassezia sp. CBS 17886]|nr:hypothetical protein MSPP1_003783 [Malassezia sp. CBS 17886]